MRILHVVPSYLPALRYGGPIYTVHALSRALVERGHNVHVFTTNVDGPTVSNVPTCRTVDLDGVSVWYFPTGVGRRLYRSPAMGWALQEKCKTFDIVHLHSVFLWPTLVAARIARRESVPYVLSPHGMLVRELIARKSRLLKSTWIALFERRNVEQAEAIHSTSQIEAEQIHLLGINCRRNAIIPNGLNLQDVSGEPSADDLAWLGSVRQPFILYLGRINWKKGLDLLISAMSHVERVRLVVAGNDDEKYQQTLLSLANQLGNARKIQFVGPVAGARKWALLRQAKMLLLPSYSENFGMVVLEAMAVGCPVIVTPEVGLAETVTSSGAGLVVKGVPAELATAIVWLEQNEDLRKKMGVAGRKAINKFAWANIAEKMENLYRECVERQHGSRSSEESNSVQQRVNVEGEQVDNSHA